MGTRFRTKNYGRALRDNLALKMLVRSTRRALPVYASVGDDAGLEAFGCGGYSRAVVQLIESFTDLHGGWFVDVGAHIGLISAQLGPRFRHFELIEASPIAANVLRANMALTLPPEASWRVHEVALGVEAGEKALFLPHGNPGGAFLSEGNRYSVDRLARKDGFDRFDSGNYRVVPVAVVDARSFLRDLLEAAMRDGRRHGVIKIDIEGFEQVVLETLLSEMPRDVRCKVILENHDPDYDLAAVAAHPRVACVEVLRREPNVVDAIARISRRAASYLAFETHGLSDDLAASPVGEVVVTL